MDLEIARSQKHAKNRNYCYEIPPVVMCTFKKTTFFFSISNQIGLIYVSVLSIFYPSFVSLKHLYKV